MAESMVHEALVSLFRDRAELARELVEPLGFTFAGDGTVETGEGDLTQAKPLLARADLVQVFRDRGRAQRRGTVRGRAVLVVEVQLSRRRSKRLRWPLYATTARVRYRCDEALVLVIAPDAGVAE